MKWETLTSTQQFLELLASTRQFAIFKHSTRCAVSSMAKSRVEREWNFDMPIYYLDLIRHRDVSDLIADTTHIEHESPQLIVFKDGQAVYHASHNGILVENVKAELAN
jgi:bacillithiol system protein YtxJ